MSAYHIPPLSRLIDQFEKLPGIGRKSAQRLAYYVLGLSDEGVKELADAILDAHKKIHYCKICCNLTDEELCPICRNPARDHSVICVVEDPRDVIALERTHEFNAVYHVLHGVISPLNGIGPDQLCIKELLC
jgi:recombination protein RecR